MIVGYAQLGTVDQHAFLYTATNGMQDLNGLLDASGAGWSLTTASGISGTGYITGSGMIDRIQHAFLLTPEASPVSEPGVLAALGLGTLVDLRRRR